MYMEKKVHISWRVHKCYNCDGETVTTGVGSVNGWAPMSRREQRRARKAAKNLAMFKTYGRRPWSIADDVLSWPSAYNWTAAKVRHLREPSGFKAMSSLAHEMALTKAHERAYTDEAVSCTSERFKELLAAFTHDINAAAGAGLSIYDLGEEGEATP